MTTGTPAESGLQFERTSLAWNRTALTAVALGATTVRAGVSEHSVLDLVATVVSLVAGIAMYLCSRRSRSRRAVEEAPVGRRMIQLAATSAVVAVLCASAAIAVHALGY